MSTLQFNKQIAIILVLTSLLLSALGAVYYFYTLNKTSLLKNDQLRVIYLASKNIKKDKKIDKGDLKRVQIAKKFILTTPLLKKEIIGKYAKENIYKNDMFRKEKIKSKIADNNKTVVAKFKYNVYNIAYKMFKNPNYAIRQGDVIDIISVYPATQTKFTTSPNSVQYVAKQIKVLGFLVDGNETSQSIVRKSVTRVVKKKQVKQTVEKKAEDMLIDIDSNVLISLIDDYNRGNQLWMVKTHLIVEKVEEEIEQEDENITIHKSKIKHLYLPRLYKARDTFENVKATIHYADDKQATVLKRKTIKIETECKENNNYIIALLDRVHLRSGASYKYRIKRTLFKNYIIPYRSMANPNWFITCDGFYINKNEAKVITKEEALKKLDKK